MAKFRLFTPICTQIIVTIFHLICSGPGTLVQTRGTVCAPVIHCLSEYDSQILISDMITFHQVMHQCRIEQRDVI